MRRLLLIPLLLLLTAAPAAGKGVTNAKVCGTEGCATLEKAGHGVIGGADADPPAGAEGFIVVKAGIGDGQQVFERITLHFLPKSGLLRAEDGWWYQPDPASVKALRSAAFEVGPRPASRLEVIAPELGGKIGTAELCGRDECVTAPTDPTLGSGQPADAPPAAEPFVELNRTPSGAGPEDAVSIQFLPQSGLILDLGGVWMRPDDVETLRYLAEGLAPFPAQKLLELAPELAAPDTQSAPAPPPDGGGPSAALIIGLALAAFVVAAAVVAVRRRPATS